MANIFLSNVFYHAEFHYNYLNFFKYINKKFTLFIALFYLLTIKICYTHFQIVFQFAVVIIKKIYTILSKST